VSLLVIVATPLSAVILSTADDASVAFSSSGATFAVVALRCLHIRSDLLVVACVRPTPRLHCVLQPGALVVFACQSLIVSLRCRQKLDNPQYGPVSALFPASTVYTNPVPWLYMPIRSSYAISVAANN
jgi:hypothetical protein